MLRKPLLKVYVFLILDSGANDHITGESVTLTYVSSLVNSSQHVRFAVKVHKKYIVHLSSNITLDSVLYVPHFALNLLSVNRLARDLYYAVVFLSNHCYLQDFRSRQIFGKRYEHDGPYYFEELAPPLPPVPPSSVTRGAWLLDIGRLLIGCGVGVLSYVVPVYVAEITPKNLRGGFTTMHQLLMSLGASLSYFIGTAVTWRTLAAIGTIPCVVQLLGLIFIPESPRWLAKVGREKEYEASLQRLRGKNADISQEAADIRIYTETLKQLPEARILDMFQRKYAHSLIVGVGVMVLQQFGGTNAIAFYASSIFESAGFSAKVGTIAMAAVQIPMTILGAVLMDRAGRRPLLMVSAAGTCLGFLIVGFSFLLQDFHKWEEGTPILVLVGILVYNGSFGLGVSGIPWLIMSEIFPINMKGSAGSLMSLVNWSCSWVVTYLFNFSMEWSSAGTFFIFCFICGLTVVFVEKLVPETKGQTLEEIQASMTRFQ